MSEAARRLGIEHPIVQGPFGGGLSTTRLAATVSNLGGLGSFGAHHLAPEDIGRVAGELRSLTARPFALNLWVSNADPGALDVSAEAFDRAARALAPWFDELGVPLPARPERFTPSFDEQVEALLAARPPVFSFIFGVPPAKVLAECRRLGIVTSGAATTLAEARALDEAGVDLIVATGFEAGGHRPSFLERAEDSLMGTFALVPVVADRVKAPVIAAGGIADARGVRAALTLGAQAAQLGTAFLACEESGTTDEHRALLFSERAERTALTRAFSGRLARGLRNRWVEEVGPLADGGAPERARAGLAGPAETPQQDAVQPREAGERSRRTHHTDDLPPYPVTSWLVSRLRPAAVAARRTDLVSLWGGQAAPTLRHRTASALMASLVE